MLLIHHKAIQQELKHKTDFHTVNIKARHWTLSLSPINLLDTIPQLVQSPRHDPSVNSTNLLDTIPQSVQSPGHYP
jgi:hypothetical protein